MTYILSAEIYTDDFFVEFSVGIANVDNLYNTHMRFLAMPNVRAIQIRPGSLS